MLVFWVVMSCRFASRYILEEHAASNVTAAPPRWRQYVPPKCLYLPQSQHGFTTQKININNFFIMSVQITSSLQDL